MAQFSLFHLVLLGLTTLICTTTANRRPPPLSQPASLSSTTIKIGQSPLRFHRSKITLSGFSSGGTFAQMLQFSYSSLFHGIAVFSHNFYRCGPPNGDIDDYDKVCTILWNATSDKYYNPDLVHRDIEQYALAGQIESVQNLRNKKLYVYAGLRSFLFNIEQSMGILKVYERYIQNPKAIRTRVQDANLVLPTNNNYGPPCIENANMRSFIGSCGFSGAHEALNFLLDDNQLQPIQHNHNILIEPQPGQRIRLQPLLQFDQSEFYEGITNHNMDSIGLMYIPSSGCRANQCLLHFYFHGCFVGRELNGTAHIKNSGYLELAELNQILMIFPQVVSTKPKNEIGCWDTFGLGGPLYATQEGPQIRVVKKILDKLIAGNSGGGGNNNFGGSGPGLHPQGIGAGGGSFFGNRNTNNNNGNSFSGFRNPNPSGSFSAASTSISSSNNNNGPVHFGV